MAPLLLCPRRAPRVTHLDETILLDDHFGTLARSGILEEPFRPPGPCGATWENAIAFEILLASSWHYPIHHTWWDRFAEAQPFPPCSPLAAWQGHKLAVVAFPTDISETRGEPPWCLLALVADHIGNGQDHRARFTQWPDLDWTNNKVRIYLRSSQEAYAQSEISGPSWTAAATIAWRAVQPDISGTDRETLACRWMISGDVQRDHQIRWIDLGRKPFIRTQRQWLLPPECREFAVGLANRLHGVSFPATVDAAWNLVTGRGAIAAGELATWPRDVEVLYSFTSTAWTPILAFILQAAPKRVVLGKTEAAVSQESADLFERLLTPGFWTAHPPQCHIFPIASDDLPAIEKGLAAELEDDLRSGRVILFNVTQGNRLMSYAAIALARLHSNLWLIYRNVNDDDYLTTVIHFEGLEPTVMEIRDPGPLVRHLPEDLPRRLFDSNPPPNQQPREKPTPESIRDQWLGGKEAGEKISFGSGNQGGDAPYIIDAISNH